MTRQQGSPEEISRRGFLFGKSTPKPRPELGVNERLVETDSATFIMNYSYHHLEVPAETVGDNLSAVLIELDLDRVKDIDHPIMQRWIGAVLKAAKEKGLPVFLIDISYDQIQKKDTLNRLGQFLGVGLMGGVAFDTYFKKAEGEKVSRRRVLGRTLAFFTGAYLVVPSFLEETETGRRQPPLSYQEPIEDLDESETKTAVEGLNDATRPDWLRPQYEISLRDAVMAQKASIVAELLSEGAPNKPQLKMYVGARHTGVAKDLKSTEAERLEKIGQLRGVHKIGPIVRIDFVNEEGQDKMKITLIEETRVPE